MEPVRLAPLDASRLDEALALSRAVGWPHRREDWALNLSLGKGLAALRGDEIVGSALATFYGGAHATVNMVIVDERLRGTGLGGRLTRAALELAEGRETRLVATKAGLPLYEKLGFATIGPISQHQAFVTRAAPPRDAEWTDARDLPAISDIDRAATGMDRSALIARLAESGRLAVTRRAGAVTGYGAIRDFGRGAVVGPVAADGADAARALIELLLSSRPGAFLRLDTPQAQGLSPWLEALGLPQVGGGLAMRRPAPGAPLARADSFKTYALASQALG